MNIEEKIKELEKSIITMELKMIKLEGDYVPNQDLKSLKERLVNRVKYGNFQEFRLDEGCERLNPNKLRQMLCAIEHKDNFYILLAGSNCDVDISLFDFRSNEESVFGLLKNLNIKRMSSNLIDKDKCYLITLDNINQETILDENVVSFTKE